MEERRTDGEDCVLDTEGIKKILPHREPFLFVDRILKLEKGVLAVGVKRLTGNEDFFKGHFPGKPVMPGVLMIEALAQVGGVMMMHGEETGNKLGVFLTIDNAKFRKTVAPGDRLILEVHVVKARSRTASIHGKATVNGETAAEADMMFAIIERR